MDNDFFKIMLPHDVEGCFSASIKATGNIWLNNVCFMYCLSDYDFVRVIYNEAEECILIQPYSNSGWIDDIQVFLVRPVEQNGAIITAKGMIWDIANRRTIFGKYKPIWDTEHRILRIDLKRRITKYGD